MRRVAGMSRAPSAPRANDASARARAPTIADDAADDERCVAYAALDDGADAVPCAEFRVTCPDKTGLGADICRVVFEFGLVVTRGDFTTDGVWALVLLTVRAGALDRGVSHGSLMDENAAREGAGAGAASEETGVGGVARRVARRAGEIARRVGDVARKAWLGARGRDGRAKDGGVSGSGDRGASVDRGLGRERAAATGSPTPASMSSPKLRRFEGSAHGGNAALAELEESIAPRTCVVDWELLRQRLELLCPHKSTISTIPSVESFEMLEQMHANQSLYILQVEAHDRVGLLHDVTLALWELQLTVHRAHVTTAPCGKAVDLFYVTDDLHELPNPSRVGDISRRVKPVVARTPEALNRVNILVHPAPSFVTRQGRTKTLRESSGMIVTEAKPPVFDYETTVEVDNLMSPAHTVFQIRTRDRQGLLYDCLRVSKDLKVSVSYAKIEIVDDSICEVALFTRNIENEEQMEYLCAKYKEHVDRPLKVEMLCHKGESMTSELRVVAPLDISGHTRPRVLLDVTEALQALNVMVFKADILIDPRTVENFIQDEVHRFLLTDFNGEPISSPKARQEVCDSVIYTLLR